MVVEPVLPSELSEWAASTLFDHVVDAVLNWLDHGDPERDNDTFVVLEAAGLRETIRTWS